MASVEKRGSVWCVRYVVKDAFGNIVSQKRKGGFRTKGEAMAAARELEQATARGVDVHGDQLRCGDLMEKWFLTKAGTIEITTLAKYNSYIDRLRKHPIYDTKVSNLRKDSLKTLIEELSGDGVSIKSATYYTEPLRFALRWAAGEGIIPYDPFSGASRPKSAKRKQVILSDDDINDMIRVCKSDYPAFLTPLYLALYGGLCREEVAGLKWSCVDTSSVRIQSVVTSTVAGKQVEKGPKTAYRSRTVTLPKFVMDHLRSLKHTSEYVCVSRSGDPYYLSTYPHTVAKLAAKVNKERAKSGRQPMQVPSFHDLRHTHAAMCISMGIQPKVISERLGHSSITVTMDLYGYLMPGLQEQVAEAFEAKWS